MKISKRTQHKQSIPKWFVVLTILVILLGGYLVYAAYANLWPFTAKTATDTTSSSTIPNDNEDYVQSGGGSGQDDSQTAGSGITDTEGENVKPSDSGISSSSKNITLYNPAKNQHIKSGDVITGKANVQTVYYRINDDINGMISNGQLKVVDGKFSGVINVNTRAKNGTFEVYSFNAEGQEVNNISIEVAY